MFTPNPYFVEAFNLAHRNFPDFGICLEFGVLHGNSYCWQAQQIASRGLQSRLYGFDSWKGLPDETDGVWRPDRHAKGRFAREKKTVLNSLEKLGLKGDLRFQLVDGFFSESLTSDLQNKLNKDPLKFVNIDVDIHSSTIEVLDFCLPLMRTGTVLWFDDWMDPQDVGKAEKWGEHLAWEDWNAKHPSISIVKEGINPKYNQRYFVLGV